MILTKTKGISSLLMEYIPSPKHEDARREKSTGKPGYLLFDEKTLNFFLYGTKKTRVIDVNKLKRKAENDQESSCSKKQKITTDHEEPRLTNAIRSFPDEVQLCMSSIPGASYGVCAKEHIPLGTWIGPYEGRRITPQRLTPDIDSSYLWEIFKDGKLSHYLDGSDEETSSWMRFIRCARHVKEQNMYAFQYCGNIFYRAFKEIPPGRELLVWYDDKYPQFLGIPLVMQDYEFYRDAATSSNSRGSPKISSTSTQVTSSTQDAKKYGFMDSRENLYTGNFIVQSARAVQPRLTRPISSVGSSFGRGQVGPPAVKGGPGFAGPCRGENKRTEIGFTPTSANDRQPVRTSMLRPLSTDSKLYQMQTRRKDLPKTEQELSREIRLKSKVAQGHSSNKQLKLEADMVETKDSLPTKSRGLPQGTALVPEVTRSQFIDNGQQISPRTSEGQALKDGHSSERSMPALHPHLPQAPPLHRINHFYYEPVKIQTSGVSSEDFGMWRCRQCLKTFTQRLSLQMHECSQTPEKPYQCGQCTLSFATPSELRSHADVHTSDKLYKCGFCSRAFSGATTLNNHIRTHTGEKPFNCDKCNKTFSQASHLARHQRVPGECVKIHRNSDVKSSEDS